MAILIVVILHMHLTAWDQTLAVALATAGWALEDSINHRHEKREQRTFHHVRVIGLKGGDLHARSEEQSITNLTQTQLLQLRPEDKKMI